MPKTKPLTRPSIHSYQSHSNQSNFLKFSKQSKQPTHTTQPNVDNQQMKPKYFETNTSLTHVLAMISMGICRKITNNGLIRKRLIFYLCLVLIGGLVNDFAPLISRSFMFKIQKTNVLNQWFVKIGWFWTTLLTFPLMTLTSVILKDDKQNSIDSDFDTNSTKPTKLRQWLSYLRTRQLLRLLINTIVWFISTNLFFMFEDFTGSCLSIEAGNDLKSNCLRNGHKWMPGFDISGHTFLLIYSNLILLEECAVMCGWEPFGHQLFEQTKNKRENQTPNTKQWKLYNQYLQALRVLFILITILSLIWDFMLVQTSLFYHTMFQKLVAAVWAVSVWALTYRYFYRYIEIDVKAPKLKNKNS